jgi:hypothetical protein
MPSNKFLIIIFSFLLFSCKNEISKEVKHPLTDFEFLSLEEARKAVVQDSIENYFEKVNMLEMSIQMKMPKVVDNREDLLKKYKKCIQDDIEAFNENDLKILETRFTKALDQCKKLFPNLKLPKIKLLKTRGNYYGKSVYYTRENMIVIPTKQIREDNETLLKTLMHEIFHIYSRYNRDKRNALYALIGYKKIENLELSEFLKRRIIYNPDGVDISYSIQLKDSVGNNFSAIPCIYSKYGSYKNISILDGHIFQLFEVRKTAKNKWKVVSDDVGLGEESLNGYWEQIGRNTSYTIHPDEILADNFSLILLSEEDSNVLNKLDEGGKLLLKKITTVIKE